MFKNISLLNKKARPLKLYGVSQQGIFGTAMTEDVDALEKRLGIIAQALKQQNSIVVQNCQNLQVLRV